MDVWERVNAGAKWFDENYPGWVDKVDLETLDMHSDTKSVPGQVCGTYSAFVDCVPNFSVRTRMGCANAGGLMVELGQAWKELIENRRGDRQTTVLTADQIFTKWAKEGERIKANGTIGDYTITGLFAHLRAELIENGHL